MIALTLNQWEWWKVVYLLHDCWHRGDVSGYLNVREWAVEQYA